MGIHYPKFFKNIILERATVSVVGPKQMKEQQNLKIITVVSENCLLYNTAGFLQG